MTLKTSEVADFPRWYSWLKVGKKHHMYVCVCVCVCVYTHTYIYIVSPSFCIPKIYLFAPTCVLFPLSEMPSSSDPVERI